MSIMLAVNCQKKDSSLVSWKIANLISSPFINDSIIEESFDEYLQRII